MNNLVIFDEIYGLFDDICFVWEQIGLNVVQFVVLLMVMIQDVFFFSFVKV